MTRLPRSHRSLAGLLGTAAALLLAGVATAQDLVPKAPPQTAPVAIRGATVHTAAGDVIEDGVVVFADGVITAVGGAGTRVPAGAEVIDASGHHLYPGLIGAATTMGLTEIGSVRATIDTREIGSITPEVRAIVAVNPDSTIIPVTRANGVLTCGVMPLGGLVTGRAAVIRMDGWTWEDMAVEGEAGLVVNWPSLQPRVAWWSRRSPEEQRREAQENLDRIGELFDEAEAYFAARAADPTINVDLRWEGMGPSMRGENPVFVRANELEQIQSAVTFFVERGMRPVIVGGQDAAAASEMLRKHDVPVIVAGTHRLPDDRDDAYDEPFTLPARLEAAGVRWCLASGEETAHERSLPYNAGTAVAYGLAPEAALRAVTANAADILGVGDRLGTIEVGKSATLFLADGDCLEILTAVTHAWIDGRRLVLTDKQEALNEKYREKYRQLGLIED